MRFKEHIKSPLGITFSAIGLIVITGISWSIGSKYFESFNSDAQQYYKSMRFRLIDAKVVIDDKNDSWGIKSLEINKKCDVAVLNDRNGNPPRMFSPGPFIDDFARSVLNAHREVRYLNTPEFLGKPLCFSPNTIQYSIWVWNRERWETANNGFNQNQQKSFSFPNPFQIFGGRIKNACLKFDEEMSVNLNANPIEMVEKINSTNKKLMDAVGITYYEVSKTTFDLEKNQSNIKGLIEASEKCKKEGVILDGVNN